MNLTVLTYNIFGMPWGTRTIKPILLWMYTKANADVICLQEVFSKKHREEIETFCQRVGTWVCSFPEDSKYWLAKVTRRFLSGSGLCILLRKGITFRSNPIFIPFRVTAGFDGYIQKGFYVLNCEKDGVPFEIINTHFQSDFTELPFCRYRYDHIRESQERQLSDFIESMACPIVLGDFNKSQFIHFSRLDQEHHTTYPETGEHLDHCLTTHHHHRFIEKMNARYFHENLLSDHVAVLYSLFIHR